MSVAVLLEQEQRIERILKRLDSDPRGKGHA